SVERANPGAGSPIQGCFVSESTVVAGKSVASTIDSVAPSLVVMRPPSDLAAPGTTSQCPPAPSAYRPRRARANSEGPDRGPVPRAHHRSTGRSKVLGCAARARKGPTPPIQRPAIGFVPCAASLLASLRMVSKSDAGALERQLTILRADVVESAG